LQRLCRWDIREKSEYVTFVSWLVFLCFVKNPNVWAETCSLLVIVYCCIVNIGMLEGGIFWLIFLKRNRMSCIKLKLQMSIPDIYSNSYRRRLRCCATNRKVAVSISARVSGFFIDINSFWSHYGPGVDSAFNRKEYQEYFLGVKAAGA
jgi:hypothetical protein